ncbi:MAG: glycosyltransferase family 4 protein [Bacteroidales bacterium]|nr:glycosyltransferase family 4 protein [Bacteroidales bacterium]
MRILQVCNKVPFPPKDGGSIAMFNLARGLAIEGNPVDILAMETHKHPASFNNSELPENITLETVFVETSIKPLKAAINLIFKRTPYNAERFISGSFARRLENLLKQKNYDIVQLEGLYLTPYIPVIRKNSSAKISLRSHNIENDIWKRLYKNEKSLIKKIYLYILYKRVLRMEKQTINEYDFLVPITYLDAVEYVKYGNKKPSKVIPTGIPAADIASELKVRGKRKLYFIGSLDWLPNQEGIMWFIKNVWPMLNHFYSHIEFHVAGRNAPEWFEKALGKPGIFFHGEVACARDFARGFDIMIVPLLSGGGMRVKIVEAMSLGKVIVTTTIGAEGLDLIPNYHAIITDSPADFATGVQVLMENTDFFIKLGENAIRFIRNNYTNRVLAGELANFYQANM